MPVPSRHPVEDLPSGNRKVMIYVTPDLHRAMRQVALDEDRSASDIYSEAVGAYLKGRGVKVGPRQGQAGALQAATAADLAEAIDRQGKKIEDLHAAVAAVTGSSPRETQEPVGTKAAEAMKAVLAHLKAAGSDGMDSRDLNSAVYAAGIRSGAVDGAKTVLRAADLIRFDAKRWYLNGA